VNDFIDRARHIADDVLFPSALAVDLAGVVPESNVELLAEEGYYGIMAPPEIGGAGAGRAVGQ
jgi:alkylation response protein AidB-like acyl-CoA dehydrogenase